MLRLIEDISRRATFEPHRVLVVTDDEIVASQCAAALKGPGYTTEICKDPQRVLSVVEAFNPQLIVSDLCLSLCSGLEFAMIVWQSDFGKDLEIVLLSPGPEFNDAVSRLGLPVGGFVTRPLDSSKLRACVADCLVGLKSGRDTSSRHQFISILSRRENLKSLHDFLGVSHKDYPRPGSSHSIAPPARPKILVVDDDPHIATAIKVKLEPFGLEILEAFNGIQGFKAACREQPDVIISDYEMPRGSADYLVTRLKETPKTQDIPVLILTGRKFDGGKDYALEREMLGRHGAVSYLSKPIDWDALVTELGRHISI
jgi:CheY-like chemotaxis protein